MGLQLPGELVEVLGWIGMTWPQGDEEKLFQLGKTWLDLAGTIQQAVQQSNTAAGQVWYGNGGTDIEAFQEYWTGHGPAGALNLAHTAATILGGGPIVRGVSPRGTDLPADHPGDPGEPALAGDRGDPRWLGGAVAVSRRSPKRSRRLSRRRPRISRDADEVAADAEAARTPTPRAGVAGIRTARISPARARAASPARLGSRVSPPVRSSSRRVASARSATWAT